MKKLIPGFLLISILMASCKKGTEPLAAPAAKPVAAFKINNLVSNGFIMEGNITDFENQSKNGASYKWDFGNGITSTEQLPSNISFAPCGHSYNISLTVTNKAGESASYSQLVQVLCRGKHAHGNPPVHLPTAQIPGYIQYNN